MNKSPFELMTSLLVDVMSLTYKDGNLDKVKRRAKMLILKIFGNESDYIEELNKIRYSPRIRYSGMDKDAANRNSFNTGKSQLENLINVTLEDISLSDGINEVENAESNEKTSLSRNIFIVHGHNEEMKQSSARFLEKIDFKATILHEQPNKGRTIIEKFTDYSNVDFAVILLSADDVAFNKADDVKSAKLRARQNVIFELGFFLGKIGREKVFVLHEQVDNFEIPSDYQGVIFEPYDNNGNWKLSLAKELKAVGYKIDGNKLIE